MVYPLVSWDFEEVGVIVTMDGDNYTGLGVWGNVCELGTTVVMVFKDGAIGMDLAGLMGS
jgi:hypothetical protein